MMNERASVEDVGRSALGAVALNGTPLGEVQAKQVLMRAGIETPRSGVAYSSEEAIATANRLGYPVVLKLVCPQIAHKTEVGGVVLDARASAEVGRAYESLDQAARRLDLNVSTSGVLVEQMVGPGVEMIVGIRRDSTLGLFLVLGAGGRLAELFGPPEIRTLPIDHETALSMIRESKLFPVLDGFRRGAGHDVGALADLMVKLSSLAAGPDRIFDEIELNPVIVCRKGLGACAVDAYGLRKPGTVGDGTPPLRKSALPFGTSLDPAVRALITPASVAVIGASADPAKFSHWLLGYLRGYGFPGRLYPVNPHRTEILGFACYPTIEAVPEAVDLACIVVPARAAPQAVRACARRGVRAGIVFASGFGETGSRDLENALVEAAREGGMRLCGPNTIGLIRPADSICLTFSNTVAQGSLRDGPVAVISQSGAVGGSLVARLWEEQIGTSVWVSAGNESDLEVADYILYASEDTRTRIVVVFLEGIKNGCRFREAVARAIAAGKPVIAYKSGSSETGRLAVETHTGKIAGDAALYRAYLRDCGVIEASELTEVVEFAKALMLAPLPAGSAMASLSPSGGAGSIVADECAAAGLCMAQLSAETKSHLQDWIGSGGHADNPVDVGGLAFQQPDLFRKTLEALLNDPSVDGVILPLTTISEAFASPLADRIVSLVPGICKPILVAWLGAVSQAPEAHARLKDRLPVYRSVRSAARAMAALARWQSVKASAGTRSREQEEDELRKHPGPA
ncbi:MAG: acetate--CoA ligase family protein [Bryobacteraceae bacterium]